MSDVGDVVIVCGLGHLREEGRTRRSPWLFSQQSLTEKGQKRKEGREGGRTWEGGRDRGRDMPPWHAKRRFVPPPSSSAQLACGIRPRLFHLLGQRGTLKQKNLYISYTYYAENEKLQLLNTFDA